MGVVVCLVMRWAWPGWCSGLVVDLVDGRGLVGGVFAWGVGGDGVMVGRDGVLVARGWWGGVLVWGMGPG